MMFGDSKPSKTMFKVISKSVDPKGEVHSETFGGYDTIEEAQENAHTLFRTHKYTSIEMRGKDIHPDFWDHVDSLEWKYTPNDEPRDFEIHALDFFGNRERISIYSYEVSSNWSLSSLWSRRAIVDNATIDDAINLDVMYSVKLKGTAILSLPASKALVALPTITGISTPITKATDLSASITSDASGDAPSLIADTSDDDAGIATPDIGTSASSEYGKSSVDRGSIASTPFATFSAGKANGLQRVPHRRRPDGNRRIATFFISADDNDDDDDDYDCVYNAEMVRKNIGDSLCDDYAESKGDSIFDDDASVIGVMDDQVGHPSNLKRRLHYLHNLLEALNAA